MNLLMLVCAAAHAVSGSTTDHNLIVQRALSARDERALLAALEDRGRALGSLLQSLDVAAALALARAAPRSRDLLSPSARALLQDEWASATVSVVTLRGLPLPGAAAAPHYVHLTFPGGRRVRVHPASVETAGLPVGGSVPVQGFFYMDEFVADSAGAECGAPAGSRVECVVGGEVRAFASAAAAELEVAALWRQAGARSLQMGADPASAPPQPAFEPTLTSGLRKVLLINVRFAGQGSNDASLCSMDQVRAGAVALEQLHGQRSFGKVAISASVVGCQVVLPWNASWYTSFKGDGIDELHAHALNAALSQTCTPLTNAQLTAFQHTVVYHSELTDAPFDYSGLGQVFGKAVWMNGPNATESTLCHEVGHNYGLWHASSSPLSGFKEYGDSTDVMGESYSMVTGDYSSGSKIAMGWIPSGRYVALHPHGISAASGLVSNATFSLAALDRNNVIGVDPFSSYPMNTALAARLTLPPHSTVLGTKSGKISAQAGHSVFAFLHFRAMARVPGIYIVEAALGSSAISNPILVCNEALCQEQAPLARAFDAFVYDRNGTRALIEVGALTANVIPNTPNIANTDLQNSAYQVTVSYLGSNGRKLGAALAAGCNATTGLCLADKFTDVSANGTFLRVFSGSSPVALFRVISSANSAVTIKACNLATPPFTVAPIGVSAFLGGFPTAHAFYTGSVGVSGDAVSPGEVPSAPFTPCASTTLAVYTGRVLWVAVGSPGSFRGSALSASVAITMVGSMPAPTGACPRGSYKPERGTVCMLCPTPGQSSKELAKSPQDCFCPTDFLPTASGCVGQELGGPNAISASVAAFPPCPAGKSLSGGACVDCPVGAVAAPSSSYGSACAFKHFNVIEVATVTKSFMTGIFVRNSLEAGRTDYTYTRVSMPGNNDTWAINPSSQSWRLCNSSELMFCYRTPGWALGSAGALHLITPDSLAFCDNVGDSTVDLLGRRVCYCGAGMQKDTSNNTCQACPSGHTRTVGGAASKLEVCSYPVSASAASSTLASVFSEYRSLIIGVSIGIFLLVVLCYCLQQWLIRKAANEESPGDPAPPPRKQAPSAAQTSFQASFQGAEPPPRATPKAARRPSERFEAHQQARPPSPPLRSSSALREPPGGSRRSGTGDDDNLYHATHDLADFLAACARGDAVSVAAALRAAPPPLAQRLLTAQSEPSGRSPLHLAVRAGSLPLVQLLLEWGAPQNARDEARRTPLCSAARMRDGGSAAVLVGALLSGGASVMRSDARGRTALHHAALTCNLDAVAQLLAWGAAPQAEDAEGATPLELAERVDGVPPRAMFRLRELLLAARPGAAGRGGSRSPLVLLEPGRLPRSSSAVASQAPALAEAPQSPGRLSKRGPGSVGAYV